MSSLEGLIARSVRVLGEHVLVRAERTSLVTSGGILLPASQMDKAPVFVGEIVGVGEEARAEWRKQFDGDSYEDPDAWIPSEGDRVLCSRYGHSQPFHCPSLDPPADPEDPQAGDPHQYVVMTYKAVQAVLDDDD